MVLRAYEKLFCEQGVPGELRDQSNAQLVGWVSARAKVFDKKLFVFQIAKESFRKSIEDLWLHGLVNSSPGHLKLCFIIYNNELVLRAPPRVGTGKRDEGTI